MTKVWQRKALNFVIFSFSSIIAYCWWWMVYWPTVIQSWRTGYGQRVELVAPCSEPWCSLSTPAAKKEWQWSSHSDPIRCAVGLSEPAVLSIIFWHWTLNICPHHNCVMEFFPPLPLCPAPLPLLLHRALKNFDTSLQICREIRKMVKSVKHFLSWMEV